MGSRQLWIAAIALGALAACSNAGTTNAPCGLPSPGPPPDASLAYPVANATNVPAALGELIFSGELAGATLQVESPGGPVPLGSPTAAPSPLPTPYATPSGLSGSIPYFAVPVPALSPATTYAVSYHYRTYADNPPICGVSETVQLGSFTTQ